MKKFLSLILAVALCASLFVMPVSAEDVVYTFANNNGNLNNMEVAGVINAEQAGMYKIEADIRSNKSDDTLKHAVGAVKVNDQVYFSETYAPRSGQPDFDFVGYAYLNAGENTVAMYSVDTWEGHSYAFYGSVKATYCPDMEAAITNVGNIGKDDAFAGGTKAGMTVATASTVNYTFDVPSAGIWKATLWATGNRTSNTSKGDPKMTYNIDGKYYTQNAGISMNALAKGWNANSAYYEIDLMSLYMAPRDDASANPNHTLTFLNAETYNEWKILGIKWEKVGEYAAPNPEAANIHTALNAATNAAEAKAALVAAGFDTAAIDAYLAPEVVYENFLGRNYLEAAAVAGEYAAVAAAGKNADVKLMKDGAEIAAIQNGALSVAIARDHSAEVGTKVIAAIYEGDVLKAAGVGSVLYGGRETVIDLGTLAADDAADCTLKVFYWNDLANAQPHAKIYKDFYFNY